MNLLLSAASYVPWNPARAQGFASVISSSIGNAVNIGIVIFGIICGILITIKVVKHFTRG